MFPYPVLISEFEPCEFINYQFRNSSFHPSTALKCVTDFPSCCNDVSIHSDAPMSSRFKLLLQHRTSFRVQGHLSLLLDHLGRSTAHGKVA